jgi:chemosensory pili system protein ChpA (sensor histidine kinase/response regulator)
VGANRGARPSTAAARLHRVLFVDDSLSVRKVAEQHLRTLGVEPVLAVDGEDALSKLREGPIGMIFTDLEMPRMHGYDLLRELRFLPAFRALPVVVVTSRSGDKHRQLAEQLGANGYLPKPFTPDQLRDALERWLPGTASEGQRGAGKP